MSPRQADPEVSANLILAAARLLSEEGPSALSTRRLAAAVGTSTTAVYTHFGGMDDLVRAMVHEGFRRLNDRMTEVAQTDDPVADVAALGYAYRANAIEHQYLYSIMFGGASLGGFALSDDERQHGRYTLQTLVGAVDRCMAAGRFCADDPTRVAHHMWIGVHGLVTLELGGYLIEPYDADACFQTVVCSMLVGAGDDGDKAAASMKAAGARRG
ncbi:TetR/AcrR family transcriptional regulator [Streptomyces sp. NBC_00457]|uniref:TetR/AcrR family transcriptional regulator n=1 Tax=Streptomyces sp. NBC_00457 TaxID=2975748 RepID=UPI002E201F2F